MSGFVEDLPGSEKWDKRCEDEQIGRRPRSSAETTRVFILGELLGCFERPIS